MHQFHLQRTPLGIETEIKSLQKQPLEMFYKKGVLKNFAKFTGKHLHQSLFFDTLTQLFSCEFYEIFKNIFLQCKFEQFVSVLKMLFKVCLQE